MEMGADNQQKINQNLNTTAQSVNAINNFQGRNRLANYQQSRKDFTGYPTVPRTTSTLAFALIVDNAGVITFQISPANRKTKVITVVLQVISQ